MKQWNWGAFGWLAGIALFALAVVSPVYACRYPVETENGVRVEKEPLTPVEVEEEIEETEWVPVEWPPVIAPPQEIVFPERRRGFGGLRITCEIGDINKLGDIFAAVTGADLTYQVGAVRSSLLKAQHHNTGRTNRSGTVSPDGSSVFTSTRVQVDTSGAVIQKTTSVTTDASGGKTSVTTTVVKAADGTVMSVTGDPVIPAPDPVPFHPPSSIVIHAETDSAIQFQLNSGGSDPQYSIRSGSLPDGLTLSADGAVSGSVTEPGTSAATITVSAGSETADIDFSFEAAGGTAGNVTSTVTRITENADGTTETTVTSTVRNSGGDTTATRTVTVTDNAGSTVSENTTTRTVVTENGVTSDGSDCMIRTDTTTRSGGAVSTVRTEWRTVDGATRVIRVTTDADSDGNILFQSTETSVVTVNGDGSKSIESTVEEPVFYDPGTGSSDISGNIGFYAGGNGKMYLLTPTGNAEGFYRVEVRFSGIHDAVGVPAAAHVKIEREINENGVVEGTAVTYKNGIALPSPLTPSIRLAPRYKADPDTPGEWLRIPYTRAELWIKILPGGVETAESVWHCAGVVEGGDLDLHATGAPLKIFGRVDLPSTVAANDGILLLLRLIDADGTASGEAITEGSTEPVIALPADKTNPVTGTSSTESEYAGTEYTSPYLYRIQYNGKRSLK